VTGITGVHGIGNHHYLAAANGSVTAASEEISADWTRALESGLANADPPSQVQVDLKVAYYAHLLHRGTAQGDIDPVYLDDEAQDLLIAWVEQLIPAPMPQISQGPRTARARAAADWLTRHLGEPACRVGLMFCREVSTYLHDPARRQAVRDAVAKTIADHQPEIVIAHSLGSVVAYETLWQHPRPKVDLLLTLGSPLAIPGVIFDCLDPRPTNGRGARPPGAAAWANLADIGDIVAVPRTGLAPYFDGLVRDDPAIIIGKRVFHGIQHYLACSDTAQVLVPYLTQQDGDPRGANGLG
jgi:hypothetical protein